VVVWANIQRVSCLHGSRTHSLDLFTFANFFAPPERFRLGMFSSLVSPHEFSHCSVNRVMENLTLGKRWGSFIIR